MNEDNTTYRLTEAERRHIADVQAQRVSFQQQVLQLEGQIRICERELAFIQRHLTIYVSLMANDHGLPIGSSLSSDLSVLVAREVVNGG